MDLGLLRLPGRKALGGNSGSGPTKHMLDLLVHRYHVFSEFNNLEGLFTNLRCAQDTITYRPERMYVGSQWYVIDYVTGKRFEKGQTQ